MKYLGITAALLGLLVFNTAPARADMDKDDGPKTEKMQYQLGLSADQSAKLKTLWEKENETMKPLMEKQHALMDKLKDQVKNKATDADIQTTLTDLKNSREEMRTQMEQFQSQKAGVLTPTQQAKMLLSRHNNQGGHEHKMHTHNKSEH